MTLRDVFTRHLQASRNVGRMERKCDIYWGGGREGYYSHLPWRWRITRHTHASFWWKWIFYLFLGKIVREGCLTGSKEYNDNGYFSGRVYDVKLFQYLFLIWYYLFPYIEAYLTNKNLYVDAIVWNSAVWIM